MNCDSINQAVGPTVLETLRLRLGEFTGLDADPLCRVLCDATAMRFYPVPFDRAKVEDWIARNRQRYANDGYGLWAMRLKSTCELIGDCGLIKQAVDGTTEVEIGYHLRRDQWGNGYATEAALACRDYAFQRLPVAHVISLIRPENLPSCRVAERAGMALWKLVDWRGIPHRVYRVTRQSLATPPAP